MMNLKRLEKKRRKAAFRSVVAMAEMENHFREKRGCERAIEEIKRKKNPAGVWAQLARIEAGIEQLGRAVMKSRAASAS